MLIRPRNGGLLLLPCPVKQPEQTKRVADGDGVAWPAGRCLRSTGYESEVDERDSAIPILPITSRQIAGLNPQPWTNTKCIFGVNRFTPWRCAAKRGRRAH